MPHSSVPQYRHKGIAVQMIKEIVRMYQLTYLEAETDAEAVKFYKKMGFQIQSLGENIRGLKGFIVIWKIVRKYANIYCV